jgi:hypothetical protein
MTIKLSTVNSDFASFRQQLQNLLSSYNSWKDLVPGSTGQIILDFIAGVGANNQYAIERAVQEVFMETANADSSVYALARLLGSRIQRKQSSTVTVSLTRTNISSVDSLPPYTQFTIDGKYYVNTSNVTFNSGVSAVSVDLTEGQVLPSTYTSDGSDFQIYQLGNSFSCSDTLVQVLVNGVEWTKSLIPLWNDTTGLNVYQDTTTPSGQLEIKFGNGINGGRPKNNDVITINQFTVIGNIANNSTTSIPVAITTRSDIVGLTTTPIIGGTNELPVDSYKYLAPRLYAANGRGVTRKDLDAIIRTYAGVLDVKVVGEAEVRPADIRWMNMIGILLLTSSVWSQTDQDNFLAWLSQFRIMNTTARIMAPTPLPTDVALDILVDAKYSLVTVQQLVQVAINNLFTISNGTIGKTLYYSDVIQAALGIAGVKHVNMTRPTQNIQINYSQYVTLHSLTINPSYVS